MSAPVHLWDVSILTGYIPAQELGPRKLLIVVVRILLETAITV